MTDPILAHLSELLPFILIGFGAQMIDGALGMAYGVISSTLLLALGVPPSRASASVHAAETFTTAVSAISHIAHRNVDWRLFSRLIIPGVIGGVTGAYILSNIDGSVIKPFVQLYLTAIGVYLIWRGFHLPPHPRDPKWVAPLGLVGAFMDASGGGGWGPIVTSNGLIRRYAWASAISPKMAEAIQVNARFIGFLPSRKLTSSAAVGRVSGSTAPTASRRPSRR